MASTLKSGERGRDVENTSAIDVSVYFTDTGTANTSNNSNNSNSSYNNTNTNTDISTNRYHSCMGFIVISTTYVSEIIEDQYLFSCMVCILLETCDCHVCFEGKSEM